MYELNIHKHARKYLQKTPKRVKKKAIECIMHLKDKGTKDCPYAIDTLKGEFSKFKYFEAKIDKDYRIIFRIEGESLYIRTAGTHNKLGTG